MTVASTTNRVDYTGNGSTTVFSFTFRIFEAGDLVVTKADSDGVETTLVLDTDYTVTGAGSYSGGSITLGTALPSGYDLTIQRVLDITQETDLRNQGQFFAETHEDVFDRMVMIGQQLQEQIDRAAKLPITNTADAEELVTDIVALADNLTELTAIYNALSDIQTVADDLNEGTSEIEVVAGSIANVNTVGNNITNVNTVAGISSNVTTVAGISANVTTVAGISSAVSGVASISAAVSAVNSNSTNINAVNSNSTNINTCATNISAIIDAPNQATSAANSAAAAAASVASGMYSAVQDKSANYTVVVDDAGDLIRVTTTSGAVTITLPAISTVSDGFKVALVKWTSDANVVNIARAGSDTINGATSAQIGSQYSQIILVADAETSTWFASQSGLGATNINVDNFSGNASTTAFTLTSDPSTENNTQVFISGVYQDKDTYSVSGTTLTFSTAPPTGTGNIEVVYGTPLAIGTPSDGTVTEAKIATSAVTVNKIADGAVTVDKIANNAVTADKIAANTVTPAKMSRTGTAGQVLTSGGAGADPSYTTISIPVDVQIFNAGDADLTWDKPTAGQTMCRIQVWGGGGGGARQSTAGAAGGGGGGGYNEVTVPLSYINSQTVTVGAAGVGRVTTTGVGTAGGNSSVVLDTAWNGRTTIAAYGGGGGSGSSKGGSGGGQLSAGTTSTATYLNGGGPILNTYQFDPCQNGAPTQGGVAYQTGIGGVWHGGGGSIAAYTAGGSIFGGGGGGPNTTVSGKSLYGGDGGANSVGATPAGGGGSSPTANVNGSNGGAGRVVITSW
jgi:hypothetical protein